LQRSQPDSSEPGRTDEETAHPEWFRAPARREHWIAAGLFVGFGIFFLLLFVVNRGWWFRWIILVLAVASIWHGLRHALHAGKARRD
jgi:hypothetical protein